MTPTVAHYLQIALGVVSVLLVGATGWAVVLSFRGFWARARNLARTSFSLLVAIFFLAWFAIPALVAQRVIAEDAGADPSSKARVLAEAISEGMNCSFLALLGAPIAMGTWAIAAWRARKAPSTPPPP
jgi:hypothetical protein